MGTSKLSRSAAIVGRARLFLREAGNKLQGEMENNPREIIEKIKLYFSQAAELYGDEFLFATSAETAAGPIPQSSGQVPDQASKEIIGVKTQNLPDRKTESERNLKEKSQQKGIVPTAQKTIRVMEDHGLFESAVLKPEWKIDPHWSESDTLQDLDAKISSCMKCQLGSTRKNFVFGVGNPKAKLVLIGEAPGADEDEQGEPFVGRAGQLLNKILAAVQLKREDVYICNILKCRPPNNRDPLPEEVAACEPFLKRQLEIMQPKLILCLGRIAAQTLLKTKATLSELRNNIYQYQGIKVLVTFHPAALLRNPNWKRPAWEDVQKMRKMYDELS
ncbi:MAG: uracil-DNA glycosylase [Candidatus Kryptoniota bacterium]